MFYIHTTNHCSLTTRGGGRGRDETDKEIQKTGLAGERERQTDRQRQTETERQRDRDRDRDRETDRDREADRQRGLRTLLHSD